MDHEISMQLARLQGEVRGYRETVATQIEAVKADVAREAAEGDREHEKIRADIGTAFGQIRDLQQWRARIVGLALGIGIGSGVVSGSVVAAVFRMIGG